MPLGHGSSEHLFLDILCPRLPALQEHMLPYATLAAESVATKCWLHSDKIDLQPGFVPLSFTGTKRNGSPPDHMNTLSQLWRLNTFDSPIFQSESHV
jgi:hypothetical protein